MSCCIRGATLLYGFAVRSFPDAVTSLASDVCRRCLTNNRSDLCRTLQNTDREKQSLCSSAPSAVHLTVCFAPASQHRGLSVAASKPLSPLQRFSFVVCGLYRIGNHLCESMGNIIARRSRFVKSFSAFFHLHTHFWTRRTMGCRRLRDGLFHGLHGLESARQKFCQKCAKHTA